MPRLLGRSTDNIPQDNDQKWPNKNAIGDLHNSGINNVNYKRQLAIRDAMKHAWSGYRQYAFGRDELQPLSKSYNDRWGNWSISLVDSLDTLSIMGMQDEYNEAKDYVRNIDFTRSPAGFQVPMFEMAIRALGGLLGAYELDNDPMLLQKAKDVGDSLAIAFETTTGLPSTRIDLNNRRPGFATTICIAESGSVQLEFKKLSQLTGDDKYRKLADRTSDVIESAPRKYKGLYPSYISVETGNNVESSVVSVGAYSDSFYEYQLKQYVLNRNEHKFKDQYIVSSMAVKEHLVARDPKNGRLFLGSLSYGGFTFIQEMEHLACFYPGLLALGAQVLDRPRDLILAEELAYTCYASYAMTPTGLGPERFRFSDYEPVGHGEDAMVPPKKKSNALSGQDKGIKRDTDGMMSIDRRYILRPETLESLFILYRVTGDPKYQEWGWNIFLGIEKYTKIESGGYAALKDVHETSSSDNLEDSMESFFLAETLKYLYLLFSPTDLISLDEYVLNTEAHPLKIIK
ncbi:Endoplasmic reticulum mannosyl-oligosaccharide 1,2-alpha-mannosidase [Coemansia sp. RSA 1813]|nr:Endoplasmic reticulum mannosyl-oligosaccharide 1,2-alpha-mannosidase [Coemansia sp. RSA 1813]